MGNSHWRYSHIAYLDLGSSNRTIMKLVKLQNGVSSGDVYFVMCTLDVDSEDGWIRFRRDENIEMRDGEKDD